MLLHPLNPRNLATVLFSGRHLLPNSQGEVFPLLGESTFHWRRQLKSVQLLKDRFSANSLAVICPGANTGYLRGKGYLKDAYQSLLSLDLESRVPKQSLTEETSH